MTPRSAGDEDLGHIARLMQDPTIAIVEGELAVTRACESGWNVRAVIATDARWERLAGRTTELDWGLVAQHDQLRALSGYDFHRGCLALVERTPPPFRLEALDPNHPDAAVLVVAALGLTDPANLGALIRNARAFAADGLWIDRAGADPLSRRAVRASAGWVFGIPWALVDGGAEVLMKAAHAGVAVVATTPHDSATEVASFAAPRRSVVCFGSEGPGLDERMLDVASARIRIALDPAVDSLNVAASSAVILHAMRRGA